MRLPAAAALGFYVVAVVPNLLYARAIPLHLGAILVFLVLWTWPLSPRAPLTLGRLLAGFTALCVAGAGFAHVENACREMESEIASIRRDLYGCERHRIEVREDFLAARNGDAAAAERLYRRARVKDCSWAAAAAYLHMVHYTPACGLVFIHEDEDPWVRLRGELKEKREEQVRENRLRLLYLENWDQARQTGRRP